MNSKSQNSNILQLKLNRLNQNSVESLAPVCFSPGDLFLHNPVEEARLPANSVRHYFAWYLIRKLQFAITHERAQINSTFALHPLAKLGGSLQMKNSHDRDA